MVRQKSRKLPVTGICRRVRSSRTVPANLKENTMGSGCDNDQIDLSCLDRKHKRTRESNMRTPIKNIRDELIEIKAKMTQIAYPISTLDNQTFAMGMASKNVGIAIEILTNFDFLTGKEENNT